MLSGSPRGRRRESVAQPAKSSSARGRCWRACKPQRLAARGKVCGRDTVAARRPASCTDHSHEDVCAGFGRAPCADRWRASRARRGGRAVEWASGRSERRCLGNVDSRRGRTWSRWAGCSRSRCSHPAGGGAHRSEPCARRRRVAAAHRRRPQRERPPRPPRSATAAPALPPLAARRLPLTGQASDRRRPTPAPLAATALDGAVVESDDYVVVDEPLVEPASRVGAARSGDARNRSGAAADGAPPSAVAESFALRPADRSVLVRNVPAPAAPARAGDHDRIVGARARRAGRARGAGPSASGRCRGAASPAGARAERRCASSSRAKTIAWRWFPTWRIPRTPSEHRSRSSRRSPRRPSRPWPRADPRRRRCARRPTALVPRPRTRLTADAAAAAWADAVLDRGSNACRPRRRPSRATCRRCSTSCGCLAVEGDPAAPGGDRPGDQSAWLRAARALDRRLPVWQLLLDERIAPRRGRPPERSARDDAALAAVAARSGGADRRHRRGRRVAQLSATRRPGRPDEHRRRRLTSKPAGPPPATCCCAWPTRGCRPSSARFSRSRRWSALAHDLRPWASGPVSLDALAALVEHYELTGSLGDADAIAELRLRMKWSDDPRLAVAGRRPESQLPQRQRARGAVGRDVQPPDSAAGADGRAA